LSVNQCIYLNSTENQASITTGKTVSNPISDPKDDQTKVIYIPCTYITRIKSFLNNDN